MPIVPQDYELADSIYKRASMLEAYDATTWHNYAVLAIERGMSDKVTRPRVSRQPGLCLVMAFAVMYCRSPLADMVRLPHATHARNRNDMDA